MTDREENVVGLVYGEFKKTTSQQALDSFRPDFDELSPARQREGLIETAANALRILYDMENQ